MGVRFAGTELSLNLLSLPHCSYYTIIAYGIRIRIALIPLSFAVLLHWTFTSFWGASEFAYGSTWVGFDELFVDSLRENDIREEHLQTKQRINAESESNNPEFEFIDGSFSFQHRCSPVVILMCHFRMIYCSVRVQHLSTLSALFPPNKRGKLPLITIKISIRKRGELPVRSDRLPPDP